MQVSTILPRRKTNRRVRVISMRALLPICEETMLMPRNLPKEPANSIPNCSKHFITMQSFLAVQGNDSGLSSLELAIRKDRNYALKVTADADFACFSAQLQGLLYKLKREAKAEAEKTIADLERELDEYVIVEETAKKEITNLLNLNKVRDLIAKDTYFDYLDCVGLVQTMQRELKEILYSPMTAKTIYSIALVENSSVGDIVFLSSDLILASIRKYEAVKLFDVLKNNLLHTIKVESISSHAVFSSDGLILAYSLNDYGRVLLRDIQTGKILCTLTGGARWTSEIAFSPDSNIIACGFWDGDKATTHLWDVQTGRELHNLKYRSASFAFSPDGLILAIGGDKTIKLWDVQLGKELRTLEGHSSWVSSVAFSHNGLILASGSQDMTIKLRNTQTCKELRTLRGHSDNITNVVFSHNGSILASGSGDKTVRLWGVHTGKELYTITGHTKNDY